MLLWKPNCGAHGKTGQFSKKSEPALISISTKRTAKDAVYRLQRYEITPKPDGQIAWKTHAGPNTFSGGTCIISEDILFMGMRQNEKSHLNKRQFLESLEKLPKWLPNGILFSQALAPGV